MAKKKLNVAKPIMEEIVKPHVEVSLCIHSMNLGNCIYCLISSIREQTEEKFKVLEKKIDNLEYSIVNLKDEITYLERKIPRIVTNDY